MSLPLPSLYKYDNESTRTDVVFSQNLANLDTLRVILPVYVRLQALQESNITLWENVPKNFSDHVASIDSRVLAIFVSSGNLGFNFSTDDVGNLWMSSSYTLDAGEYVDTLMWASSKTISENLTSLGSVPFPENHPEEVDPFLESGRKIQADNQTLRNIAANLNQTQNNMTQTVKNILDFVNAQGYDVETTKLLLSGNLNTTDILDFFKDALQVHAANSSICIERSWYAAAILRAIGVPTRTVTDVRLKTWIQVWLGESIGWVDAETLCGGPQPYVGMLPKSISAHVPWVIENSSDAMFPFVWLPEVPMRVANLTFSDVQHFDVNQYGTVMSEPIDVELFEEDPAKFRFPIAFKSDIVYAAVTRAGSNLTFSLFKGNENASKTLTLRESNSLTLEDTTVSFKPILNDNFLVMQDFAVGEIWKFDIRFLVPIVGIPATVVIALLYRRLKHRR